MEENKKQIIYLIFVIIWMIIVFWFSSQTAEISGKTSSKITEKIIKLFVKDPNQISQSKRDLIESIIRKCAHFILYAIGGFLISNFLNTTNKFDKNIFIYSILFAFGYAITDEIHQLFVSGRNGDFKDVLIDTAGSSIGAMIFLIIRSF